MPRTRAGKHKQGKPNGVGTLAVFDLGAHRLDERFDVPIYAPDGSPTAMVVTLASRYGKEYRKRKVALDRALRASPSFEKMTEEEYVEIETVNILIAQTAAWSGFVVEGVALDCTPENVRDLYTSPGLGWLVNQIATESTQRERFFVRPSSVS